MTANDSPVLWFEDTATLDSNSGSQFFTYRCPPEKYLNGGKAKRAAASIQFFASGAGAAHADSKFDIEMANVVDDQGASAANLWLTAFTNVTTPQNRRISRGSDILNLLLGAENGERPMLPLLRVKLVNGDPANGMTVRFRVWITLYED